MKTQTNFLPAINQIQLAKLTAEVKETLATGFEMEQKNRVFSAADMWNIQRRKKSFVQRRFSL
jgi:hypothetical protein